MYAVVDDYTRIQILVVIVDEYPNFFASSPLSSKYTQVSRAQKGTPFLSRRSRASSGVIERRFELNESPNSLPMH